MKKLKNGFSIMELIIALAIMGGVAAIGTVSMTGVQNRSNIKSDKLMGAEIGHAVVARETYSSNPISGIMKYDEVPGIKKYINKEYKPESMKDGYFVVTKASIDGMKRVMVGITKNNEEIEEKAIYDDGKTPGWVWVQGGEIEQLLGKDVDIGGEGCQHNYIRTVTAATCTQQGYTTYTCSKCGYSIKDSYTTATGHSWNEGVVTIEPTYENEGETTFECTTCGAIKKESIPKLSECEHINVEISREEATCTKEGKISYECSVCGETYDEIINVLDHTPGDVATCTMAQTCTVCGEIIEEEKGHTAGAKATCTTAQKCTVCDEIITPAKEHSWNIDTGICSVCGAKCVLASNWASDVTKSSITQISIVNSYNPTGNETVWNGDSGEGLVKVYKTGTKLIISGSGAGKIYAPQDSSRLFADFSNVTSINLGGLDTSEVTAMTSMFNGCSSLTSLDLSNFVTSNVRNMTCMFSGCSSLTSIDVSKFNTSAVTGMTSMFMECSSLTSIDVSGFNTSAVTTMMQMFWDCSSLTSIDVSGFNTSAVTRMDSMFGGCSNLSSLDVSGFDTSAVTTMMQMFSGCSSLTSMDVSGFNTSAVTTMYSMFYGCSNLSSLDVSGFDTSSVTAMTSMFSGCSSLSSLDVSSFDTSAATTMYFMFDNMNKLNQITIGTEFSFTGNGSASCTLPTPSSSFITGADGKWYTADRTPLTPEEVAAYQANVEEATTYYAIKPSSNIKYTITYSANGGSGSIASQIVTQGDTVKLSSNTFTSISENAKFDGWATSSNATSATYSEGQEIVPEADMALYAFWKCNCCNGNYKTCICSNFLCNECDDCTYHYPLCDSCEVCWGCHGCNHNTCACTNCSNKIHTMGAYCSSCISSICDTCGKCNNCCSGHECVHSWDDGNITTEATCTNIGVKIYTCTNGCGKTKTEGIDALGHTAGAEATCTTAQICTVCDAELAPALGHTAGAEATCTTAQICTVCGYELNPIKHLSIIWGATVTRHKECDACGEVVEGEEYHVLEWLDTTPATCTSAGETRYKCECGYVKEESIPKLEHNYVSGSTKYPCSKLSCTTDETYYLKCETCDAYTNETWTKAEALGHIYTSQTVSDTYKASSATCLDDATYYYKCENCAAYTTEKTPWANPGSALGHKYSGVATSIETAYCTTTYKYKCIQCDNIKEEYLYNEHTFEGKEWYAAVYEGEDKCCIDCYCGATTKRDGHSCNELVESKEATCTEAGYNIYKCTSPGCEYTCEIPVEDALGHDFDELVESKEATCTEDGYEMYECTNCGETDTKTLEALGHAWKESYTPIISENLYGIDLSTTHTYKKSCSTCGEVEETVENCVSGDTKYKGSDTGHFEVTECKACHGNINIDKHSGEGHVFSDGICKICDYVCPHKADDIKYTPNGTYNSYGYIETNNTGHKKSCSCGVVITAEEDCKYTYDCVPYSDSEHLCINICDCGGVEYANSFAHEKFKGTAKPNGNGSHTYENPICEECEDELSAITEYCTVDDQLKGYENKTDGTHYYGILCDTCLGMFTRTQTQACTYTYEYVQDDWNDTHYKKYYCEKCDNTWYGEDEACYDKNGDSYCDACTQFVNIRTEFYKCPSCTEPYLTCYGSSTISIPNLTDDDKCDHIGAEYYFSNEWHEFGGSDSKSPGESYTFTSSKQYYAVWQADLVEL